MVVTYRVNGNDVPRSLLVPPQNLSQRDVQKAHIVIAQNDESDLRSEFVLVLGRSDDSEVRGRHKSGFDLGERHDSFLNDEDGLCARNIGFAVAGWDPWVEGRPIYTREGLRFHASQIWI